MQQPSLFGTQDTGRDRHVVCFRPEFTDWQDAARAQWQAGIAPEAIWWQADAAAPARPLAAAAPADGPRVSKRFVQLARAAACHRASDRWALLYRLLWRLTHGERHVLDLAGDGDVARVTRYAKAVRRNVHKMKAFVRFRSVAEPGFDSPRYVAWFEPEHAIVAYAAGFFVRRFTNMRWSILTPDRCVHWEAGHDGTNTPWFSAGTDKRAAPDGDAIETAWQTYYRSIFNPARVKIAAMQSEMPVKYWKNMPEAQLIPGLIRAADRRVATMEAQRKDADTLRCGPRPASPVAAHSEYAETLARGSLERLAARAALCRACALHGPATQTVFGEGPGDARLMIVGEQPGDAEDLAGRPFVGPAGRLLDRALRAAGIDREAIYLTNAVKHFKFTPRGKQRLHAKPDGHEVASCRPWLDNELERVDPRIVICLGATAAGALLGGAIKITADRGRPVDRGGRRLVPTVHPAFVLRQREPASRQREYARFVSDLERAAAELAG